MVPGWCVHGKGAPRTALLRRYLVKSEAFPPGGLWQGLIGSLISCVMRILIIHLANCHYSHWPGCDPASSMSLTLLALFVRHSSVSATILTEPFSYKASNHAVARLYWPL